MSTFVEILRSDPFKSVGLVVLGWFLGQAEHWFAERRERRKAISRALADLLEIRHQLMGIELALREVGRLGEFPPQVASQARLFYEALMPDWNELHRRYDESVTVVAGLDPLLGFQLRSKDFIRPLFQRLHLAMSQDPQAARIGQAINQTLLGTAESALTGSILKVSRKRGLVTWYKVRRSLQPGQELQEEVRKLMDTLRTAAEAGAKADALEQQGRSEKQPQKPAGN